MRCLTMLTLFKKTFFDSLSNMQQHYNSLLDPFLPLFKLLSFSNILMSSTKIRTNFPQGFFNLEKVSDQEDLQFHFTPHWTVTCTIFHQMDLLKIVFNFKSFWRHVRKLSLNVFRKLGRNNLLLKNSKNNGSDFWREISNFQVPKYK